MDLDLYATLCNLKALYKYTDRFLTILSLVGASSRLEVRI